MAKYYSAKYDRAFKEVMLKEKNKDLLKGLLETVLKVKINKISLLPTHKLTGSIHVAEKTLDALLDTNVGKIGIEVNSEYKSYVHPRNMSYICNDYASHTLVGESYNEDIMIMQINFTYQMSKNEKAKNEYTMRTEEGKLFVKNFKIIEINMAYYLDLWYSFDKERINKKLIEENQLIIMLGLEKEELEKLSNDYFEVNKFMKELNEVNENPKFVRYMTEEEDKRKIFNSEMREARETGLKEGREEGRQEGREEGREEGRQEGIKEYKNEIIKNMLNQNLDINLISNLTGLSKEEIEKL